MRKLTFLLACLFLIGVGLVNAQSKSVSGKVLSAEDGQPVIGASVKVKDASLGTITGIDGEFSLTIPASAKTLVISFVGMKTVEVEAKSNLVVNLESDSKLIDEVVVTALGISKEKKSLGYAVSEVKGDELTKSRGGVANPINSLAGKVAGLQITGSTGQMGGSSKIVIRGVKSISGNNQPLFIIDGVPVEGSDYNSADAARGAGGYDYGNLIQDINPDDIENISVLKGPNASALYGSRATNGVIMITTKKGIKNKGFGVTYNTGIGFEKVNKMPVMQNTYGGGYGIYSEDSKGNPYMIDGKARNIIDYSLDESWGPAYDGTKYVSWLDLAKWENNGMMPGTLTESTWAAPKNDIDSFFELGMNYTNNISISQASDNAAFRASYTNTTMKGYMPNSKMSKNTFNVSGNAKVANKLDVFTNLTYLNQSALGRPQTGYDDNNVMQKFIQWGQRQLDMKELKSLYKKDDGTQATWNRTDWDDATPAYSNNPYWSRYMNYQNDGRDRLYGNAGAKVNILKELTAQYKVSVDFFSDKQYERNAVYSQEESGYSITRREQMEVNHEFLLQFNKNVGDYSISVNAGGNIMRQHYERLIGETVSGLALPDQYNLDNSVYPAKGSNYERNKGINSLFVNASVGYKSLAYIELTDRQDWSSTLPVGNNTYNYPSVTGSFIISELFKPSWLTFSKVRLGWAKVGNDTDPYRIEETYPLYTSFEGNHGYQTSVELNNPDLQPERTYSTEFGIEASMLGNRLGFDLSLYKSKTIDQILRLSLSGATGYTYRYINAGELSNKGIEVQFKGVPVKTKDFEWNVTLTASSNKNQVNSLDGETKYYRLAAAPFKVEVGAYVGEEYGVIMGTDYVYDNNGNKVVGEDGLYLSTSGNVSLGSVYPSLIGGMLNSFRYKNFDISILFDGQWGGKFFSTSYMWGMYSGMLDETAGYNELGVLKRDSPDDDGGILLKGVTESGDVNTVRVDAETWGGSFYSGPAAQSVFSSDFIKLREITIGYTIPLKSNTIKNLKVSAYGRNLGLWGPDTKHFDPESATTNSGNVQGIEGGALPSIATFGFNVGFQF